MFLRRGIKEAIGRSRVLHWQLVYARRWTLRQTFLTVFWYVRYRSHQAHSAKGKALVWPSLNNVTGSCRIIQRSSADTANEHRNLQYSERKLWIFIQLHMTRLLQGWIRLQFTGNCAASNKSLKCFLLCFKNDKTRSKIWEDVKSNTVFCRSTHCYRH